MVRGRDACWEHCVLVDATRQKVRCNYCRREFSGGVYRMKFHLAQIKNKDIVPCTEVPTDVRDQIQRILRTPKKQKTSKKPKLDRTSNGQQHSSSASGGVHPNHGSSGPCGSTSPSLLFPRPSPNEQPAVDYAQKQKQEEADRKIAVFFFNNSIPFSATKSFYYQEMVDAVAECGVGYKAPSYEKMTSTLLETVKGDINDCYNRYRDYWKETGCTILCDSWSDGRTESLVAFSITCSKGTLFLKSVDVSGHADDAHYLFELLESVVLEVGIENVVQVITDSAASYVYAGRLLMAKYTSLFWSPCASYCIDKMLEDISKQEWVSTVLEEANIISRYIYSHAWIQNIMRKFTGGRELIRPRITRSVTNFLSLRSIVIQEDNLKHMFSHTEWLSSNYSRRPDAQAVKSLLYLDRFWNSAHEAVSVSEPLIKALRIVDGDMPAIGYIYEVIEKAKVAIKAYYKGIEEKYMVIWEIIDRRWNIQLHSPLHAAAAFLNPSIFYSPTFKIDLRMRNGFQEAMMKIATEDKDKVEITKEHPIYINAQGALGTSFAIMGRTLNAPGDWWAGYGYEIPTLQRIAIRILSQPCSSHWCRWNWSNFERVHNKKRNRLEQEKFCDLVYVHCNLRIQANDQNRNGKCKPIIFDEIDVSSEWPTESESSPYPLLDDSWLDNLPFDSRAWSWWLETTNTNGEFVPLILVLTLIVLVISWFSWLFLKNGDSSSPPTPPGPKGLPLVGHLLYLDPELHTYFAGLGRTYGPILKLQLGNRLGIVVSSPATAREVLKDHDITFANRDVPAAGRVATYGGVDIVWTPYGPEWRMLRKVCVIKMLSNATLDSVYDLRRRELRQTVNYLHSRVGSPINVGEQMFLTILNVITNMLWGGTVKGDERASLGAEFRNVVAEMTSLLGTPNVSDFYPGLARFDLQGIEKKMRRLIQSFDRIFDTMIDQRMKIDKSDGGDGGKESKDFLQFLLKAKDEEDAKTPLTMTHVKALLMDMVVGGSDTTANTIEFIMAEIMNNPEVMKKAQQELDNVIGKENIVEESHTHKLHYLQAVLKESLRLHPALPLLVPHCPSETCTVGGYSVPKGSRVFVNVWAIHRDPTIWENPTKFDPERFLKNEKWDYSGNDFNYFPFGSGRRICAGIAMAERMVMFSVASFLHSFDWKLPKGEKMDISEKFGIVLKKKIPLIAIPTPRLSNPALYNV